MDQSFVLIVLLVRYVGSDVSTSFYNSKPSVLAEMFTALVTPILRTNDSVCETMPPYVKSIDYGDMAERFLYTFVHYELDMAAIPENILFMCRQPGDTQLQEIHLNSSDTMQHFNASIPFGFYFHGFIGSCVDVWIDELTRVWSDDGVMNVCCLDWSRYSKSSYFPLYNNVIKEIGRNVADILLDFEQNSGINRSDFILTGHSLGNEIIGAVAKYFTPKLPLCIILDSGGVGYTFRRTDSKLVADDCQHVKAFYTDRLLIGRRETMGNENIVFNGGLMQPQCVEPICSHMSALCYYIEMIRGIREGKYFNLLSDGGKMVGKLEPFATNRTGYFYVTTSKCYPYFTKTVPNK